MNARETYDAIQTSNTAGMQQALFELLAVVQTLATATLEIAGERKLRTGKDPLSYRSRLIRSEFVELPRESTITNYGNYSSDNYGVNSLRVDVGPLAVWFSYQTPVAFQLDGKLRVIRQNQWGPTTGKHLNWIDGGNHKERVSSQEFERRFNEVLQQVGLAVAV